MAGAFLLLALAFAADTGLLAVAAFLVPEAALGVAADFLVAPT